MARKDWLILKSPISSNNPIIISKAEIMFIISPKALGNELQSYVYVKSAPEKAILVDQPTSSIEAQL